MDSVKMNDVNMDSVIARTRWKLISSVMYDFPDFAEPAKIAVIIFIRGTLIE